MKNREKRSKHWLVALLLVLLASVFEENLASLLEHLGLDRLWNHTGTIGALLLGIWGVIASPFATHVYAFVGGLLVAAIFSSSLKSEQRSVQSEIQRPDMTLQEIVDYLTTQTAWAKPKPFITDRMVEHELLDAISLGKLEMFARRSDNHGATSQLFRISRDHFDSHRFNLDAIRSRRGDEVVIKPDYFLDYRYHDWRAFKFQVQQIWPAWVEEAPVVKKGPFGRPLKK